MRRFPLLLALAVTACADSPEQITGPGSVDPQLSNQALRIQEVPVFKPGVVVARFAAGAQIPQVAAEHGASTVRALRGGWRVLRVPEGRERQIAVALGTDPRVVTAELSVPRTLGLPCIAGDGDCEPPSDLYFGLRWDLHNDGAIRDEFGTVIWSDGLVPDADTDWLEAFDQLGTFLGTARLGVVDTGILPDHPDLLGRLVAQYDAFDEDPIAQDDNGHGTHVAGIGLAYGDNGTGTPGVAWGPNVELVMVKGCGLLVFSYVCWSDDVAAGIEFAVDNGANVINLSLGGDNGSQVEQDALQYALANNVLPICAAGNDKSDVDFPAAFPECMAVSSTDWADELASYSSFGPQVEVSAPGGDTILASGYDRILSAWNNGGYVFAAGTSMAAPHVAGLATLLHALGITSAAEKRAIITQTADDIGAVGFDDQFGHGRVNVWSAVQTALGTPNESPTASFIQNCSGHVCSFTDTSTDPDGVISQWSWDFGDGAMSTEPSPSHAYPAGGDYTVTLTVTDNRGGTDAAQQTVTVTDPPPNQLPTADFTYSCVDNVCQFSDASTDPDGVVSEWSWDFGDGAVSSQQSPTHEYAGAGDYSVALTVTDDRGGTDSITQTVSAGDPPPPPPNVPPTASFTHSCTDNVCQFTDTSTDPDDGIGQWFWAFGDNSSTTNQSPGHTYASGGVYDVKLKVTDWSGQADSVTQTITVGDPPPPPPNEPPTASFTYSCTDTFCQFTDTSTDPDDGIGQWYWDFGDNSATSSQSPGHTYPSSGDYDVKLRVTDWSGQADSVTQTITVAEPPPPPNESPTADFTYSCVDLECSFTDQSTDPDGVISQWSWDFGDGAVSTQQSPSHAYAVGGDYTVTLTVTDDQDATDATQEIITVTDPLPNQGPTASFAYSCTDNVCQFTDTSTDPDDGIGQWYWDFGDNSATSSQSPGHTYTTGGDYDVKLKVTDWSGQADSVTQTITVGDPPPPPPNVPPTASFTHSCTDNVCQFTDTSTDPDDGIGQWFWAFGDNSSTTNQSPGHTYASAGVYDVKLKVTDWSGQADSVTQTITVGDPPPPPPNEPPTASFTYSCTDTFCQFTDTSTDPDDGIGQWYWDFGDNSATSSQSPGHTYPSSGDYDVKLRVTDWSGQADSVTQTITVAEPPPPPNESPTADFTYSCVDLECSFTDQSTDPDGVITQWSWDFGDGSSSSLEDASHTFAEAGSYDVSLTVTDDDGATNVVQQTITVTEPPAPDIFLTAVGQRVRGQHVNDLTWTGTSSSMELYRDGVVIITVPAGTTTYQDATGGRGGGSYVYSVCETGSSICSNEVTVTY